MKLGPFGFGVERAEFCFVDRGIHPVVWDINIYGHCTDDEHGFARFPNGMMLSAQGIPLTLSPTESYSGYSLQTPSAVYRDSGQSYFALWLDGEYETWNLEFRIGEKRGTRYLLEFQATTSFVLEHGYEGLTISAWSELMPMRMAPKTDYPMWLRPWKHKLK